MLLMVRYIRFFHAASTCNLKQSLCSKRIRNCDCVKKLKTHRNTLAKDRGTFTSCCYKWQKWHTTGNLTSLLYPGGSSGLAFPLLPPHEVCLILDKPIHWSDDAGMYLKAHVDKSSEKFAVFNVKLTVFGDHWYPMNAVLSGNFFAFVLPTQKVVISRSWNFWCYYKLSQREERRGKYLSSDVRTGPSTLINRGERFKANCSLFKSQCKSHLI